MWPHVWFHICICLLAAWQSESIIRLKCNVLLKPTPAAAAVLSFLFSVHFNQLCDCVTLIYCLSVFLMWNTINWSAVYSCEGVVIADHVGSLCQTRTWSCCYRQPARLSYTAALLSTSCPLLTLCFHLAAALWERWSSYHLYTSASDSSLHLIHVNSVSVSVVTVIVMILTILIASFDMTVCSFMQCLTWFRHSTTYCGHVVS